MSTIKIKILNAERGSCWLPLRYATVVCGPMESSGALAGGR
jgi:hypothetical protein